MHCISCCLFHDKESDCKHKLPSLITFSYVPAFRLCFLCVVIFSGTATVIMIQQQTAIKMWVLLGNCSPVLFQPLSFSHCNSTCCIVNEVCLQCNSPQQLEDFFWFLQPKMNEFAVAYLRYCNNICGMFLCCFAVKTQQ